MPEAVHSYLNEYRLLRHLMENYDSNARKSSSPIRSHLIPGLYAAAQWQSRYEFDFHSIVTGPVANSTKALQVVFGMSLHLIIDVVCIRMEITFENKRHSIWFKFRAVFIFEKKTNKQTGRTKSNTNDKLLADTKVERQSLDLELVRLR